MRRICEYSLSMSLPRSAVACLKKGSNPPFHCTHSSSIQYTTYIGTHASQETERGRGDHQHHHHTLLTPLSDRLRSTEIARPPPTHVARSWCSASVTKSFSHCDCQSQKKPSGKLRHHLFSTFLEGAVYRRRYTPLDRGGDELVSRGLGEGVVSEFILV